MLVGGEGCGVPVARARGRHGGRRWALGAVEMRRVSECTALEVSKCVECRNASSCRHARRVDLSFGAPPAASSVPSAPVPSFKILACPGELRHHRQQPQPPTTALTAPTAQHTRTMFQLSEESKVRHARRQQATYPQYSCSNRSASRASSMSPASPSTTATCP